MRLHMLGGLLGYWILRDTRRPRHSHGSGRGRHAANIGIGMRLRWAFPGAAAARSAHLVISLSHNCFAGWHCVSRFVLEVDALALRRQRPLLHVRVDGTDILSQNTHGEPVPEEQLVD